MICNTKELFGGDFSRGNYHANKMLMPLQKNIIEIGTINTTQFDGEYNLSYRGAHIWKELKCI